MRLLSTALGIWICCLGVAGCGADSDDSTETRNPETASDGTRRVSGTVTDQYGTPLVGAVVHLENTETLSVRTYIIYEEGTYAFIGLGPDVDYTLRVHYGDIWTSKKTVSMFDSHEEIVINFKLPVTAPAPEPQSDAEVPVAPESDAGVPPPEP